MAAKMIFFNNIKTIRKNVRVRVCWFIISQAFCGKNIFFPLICYSKVYIYLFSFFPLNLLLKSFYLSFFFFSSCPGGTSSTYVLQLFHMEHALYFYLFSEVFYALYKTGTICTFYLNIYKIKVNTTF